MAEIKKVEAKKPQIIKQKRVAAYARVSIASEKLEHSLSAQISYYSRLIQTNPEWIYAGVYSDNGISGTRVKKRQGFQEMMADAEAGKIDIILTKSISRFARNTVDLLKSVRKLKALGVEVRFERENIRSLSADGELMLTVLASYAQEESQSISENVKWGVRKRMENGIPHARFPVYGYRWDGDHLVIKPEEAEIVRKIFDQYINGKSPNTIAKMLNAERIKSPRGSDFCGATIYRILSNTTYTGDLILQQYYVADPISKKHARNNGELPKYLVENSHEAIISKDVFNKAQDEMKKRERHLVPENRDLPANCFNQKIKCAVCGKHYEKRIRRRNGKTECYWMCSTREEKGKDACPGQSISEYDLERISCNVLGLNHFDESVVRNHIVQIDAGKTGILVFHLKDGSTHSVDWTPENRKVVWTEERKKNLSTMLSSKKTNPRRDKYSTLTGMIKCGKCGANYRMLTVHHADGQDDKFWHCAKHCGNKNIRDHTIKDLVAGVLNIPEFDEKQMDDNIEFIEIQDEKAVFHMADGRTTERSFHEKRKKVNRNGRNSNEDSSDER